MTRDPRFALSQELEAKQTLLDQLRHVGDDEADARIKFARMPFDLGDDAPRFQPASGLTVRRSRTKTLVV